MPFYRFIRRSAVAVVCMIGMGWGGTLSAQENGRDLEASKLRSEVSGLRDQLNKTRSLLESARRDAERLRRERFDADTAQRMSDWQEERTRYRAERKALLRDRRQAERSREALRRNMRLELENLEARREADARESLRTRTEPKIVQPDTLYSRRYGSINSYATYGGVYSRYPLGLGYGLHGRVFRYGAHDIRSRFLFPHTRLRTPSHHRDFDVGRRLNRGRDVQITPRRLHQEVEITPPRR